jgi:hypothetical protein
VVRVTGLSPPVVPVTVINDVPPGVDANVEIVRVVEHVGLHGLAENTDVAPLGSPDALKDTGCVEPADRVAVMVVVPEAPAVSVTLPEFVSA